MSRRIPEFTAEASLNSLHTSSINKSMTYDHSIVSSQIVPQVMQDPNRPRPKIIIKDNCAVICFYSGTRYQCSVVC